MPQYATAVGIPPIRIVFFFTEKNTHTHIVMRLRFNFPPVVEPFAWGDTQVMIFSKSAQFPASPTSTDDFCCVDVLT